MNLNGNPLQQHRENEKAILIESNPLRLLSGGGGGGRHNTGTGVWDSIICLTKKKIKIHIRLLMCT